MKCNVDGAFDPRTGQGATGAVLRNHSGNFCEWKSEMVPVWPGLTSVGSISLQGWGTAGCGERCPASAG